MMSWGERSTGRESSHAVNGSTRKGQGAEPFEQWDDFRCSIDDRRKQMEPP
jgi:hypothetical protein